MLPLLTDDRRRWRSDDWWGWLGLRRLIRSALPRASPLVIQVVDGPALEFARLSEHILYEWLGDACCSVSELVLQGLVRFV